VFSIFWLKQLSDALPISQMGLGRMLVVPRVRTGRATATPAVPGAQEVIYEWSTSRSESSERSEFPPGPANENNNFNQNGYGFTRSCLVHVSAGQAGRNVVADTIAALKSYGWYSGNTLKSGQEA
jgi:hypothetical protein